MGQYDEHSMNHQGSASRSGFIWVTVLSLVIAGAALGPLSLANPVEAVEHQETVSSADVATEDLAVTEKTLEQVSVPVGYSEAEGATETEVKSDEAAMLSLDEAQENETAAKEKREEVSLARALVSSPSAVLGVTFPLENADENVAISFRTRQGEQWGEWTPMDIAEPAEEPAVGVKVTVGTEPIPVVNVDEVEVSVTTEDGRSLPGAVLTVIEPELDADDLADAQLEKHGQEAVEAAESLLDERAADGVTPEKQVNELSPKTETPAADKPAPVLTPAEEAEKNATVEVNAGSGQGLGRAGLVRMAGISIDGKSYVTDVPGLTITTRKGWGADEKVMGWDYDYTTFKGAVVHHTAGSNDYTKAQVPNLVRAIYRYHAVTLGWGDVGYHLLVDKFGGVWEGRAGGLTKAIEGGHAHGANNATFGISVLGNYQSVRPTDEAIEAVARAITWKLRVHNITNLDATFQVKGKQWGKSSIMLPVISAHRHVGGTNCPGDAFMTRFEELRSKVRSYTSAMRIGATYLISSEIGSSVSNSLSGNSSATSGSSVGGSTGSSASVTRPVHTGPTPHWSGRAQIGVGWNVGQTMAAGAFSGRGRTDAMLIDGVGRLWLYPGVGNGRFPYGRQQIGTGWHILDNIQAGVDFDGDGITDVIGRVRSNGDLRLYPGNGRGGFKSARRIGTGWHVFTDIYVVGDMDEGDPVVYGIEPNGRMRYYRTTGRGSFYGSGVVGTGWDTMRSLSAVGDKNGDGNNDMVAIDAAGRMWLYFGQDNGTVAGRAQIGQGWNGYDPVMSSGDDGNLWTVDPGGRLLRYTFQGLY